MGQSSKPSEVYRVNFNLWFNLNLFYSNSFSYCISRNNTNIPT